MATDIATTTLQRELARLHHARKDLEHQIGRLESALHALGEKASNGKVHVPSRTRGRGGAGMSAAARKQQSQRMKARWEKWRAERGGGAPKKAAKTAAQPSGRRAYRISAATRKAQSARMKARWDKWRAERAARGRRKG